MLTSWNREFGTQQGRIIPPADAPALAGTYVFCLGFATAGHTEDMSGGDYALIEQTGDISGADTLLHVRARIRSPAVVPAGHYWVLEVLINDVVRAERRLVAGAPLQVKTLSVNVTKEHGVAKILTIRLRFVEDGVQTIAAADFECDGST